ncbi:MAG: hypothetical protein IKK73_01835 [Akkermansia sp.]|nr:hypothetical protein [Akkermansia sp.]
MRTVKQIKNFTAAIFRYLLTFFFSFYTRQLFIDALGIEYLGVAGLMGNVLGMLAIAELGIGSSIVFSLYKPLAEKDQAKIHLLIDLYRRLYRYIALFVLVVGLGLMPFLTAISPDLENIPHYNIIYLMFLANSVIPYFFAYNSTLYTATQQDYKLQNIRSLFYILTMGVTIAVLLWFPDYILLTACTMLLGILSQLLIYYMAHRKWPWLKNKAEGALSCDDIFIIKKNVKAMVLHKIGDYSINGTSNLIIASAVNLTAVGLLANYATITHFLKACVQEFFHAMIAGTGELIAVSPKEKVHNVFQEMNFLAFWFFGLCMTGLYFCCDQVINIWLGEGFLLNRLAVLFIATDIFVMGMRVPPYIIKSGAGMFANDRFAPLIQAAINLSVGIILARQWGVAGVAFSVLLSGLCVPSWFRPYVIYRDYFKRSFKTYIATYLTYGAFLGVIFAILSYLFFLYLPTGRIPELLYRIALVLIVFHIMIAVCGVLLPQGRACFARIRNIIFPIFNKLCRKI